MGQRQGGTEKATESAREEEKNQEAKEGKKGEVEEKKVEEKEVREEEVGGKEEEDNIEEKEEDEEADFWRGVEVKQDDRPRSEKVWQELEIIPARAIKVYASWAEVAQYRMTPFSSPPGLASPVSAAPRVPKPGTFLEIKRHLEAIKLEQHQTRHTVQPKSRRHVQKELGVAIANSTEQFLNFKKKGSYKRSTHTQAAFWTLPGGKKREVHGKSQQGLVVCGAPEPLPQSKGGGGADCSPFPPPWPPLWGKSVSGTVHGHRSGDRESIKKWRPIHNDTAVQGERGNMDSWRPALRTKRE